MTHEEILSRMRDTNPLPDDEMITDRQLAELTFQIEESRRVETGPVRQQELISSRIRIRRLRPAVAFGSALLLALAVIGVVSLATGDQREMADRPSSSTAAVTTTTATPIAPEWNPILASTRADLPPASAICTPGTDPNTPGPVAQARPAGSGTLLAAVFDHHTGQIILVDEGHATWGFDVCTNTWTELNPTGITTGNIFGGLVYDVDSDLTVVLEEDEVFVYDASANTWARVDNDAIRSHGSPSGAAYDSVSGLIVTAIYRDSSPRAAATEAWAYDVDANSWTLLGNFATQGIDNPWQYSLVGYSERLDRLILTPGGVSTQDHTLLVNPRTGERTMISTETPAIGFGWPTADFGPAADTVYVAGVDWVDGVSDDPFLREICGFDLDSLTWTACMMGPIRNRYEAYGWFDAMVGDPINDRLVLVNGVYGTFGSHRTSQVWAIDLETGELIDLLTAGE